MASKSSNNRPVKVKVTVSASERKVERALAALDAAVQEWYAEHNPKNTEHYATAVSLTNVDDGYHICRITLNSDADGEVFTDIVSIRSGHGKSN